MFGREPVMWLAAIHAALALVIGFGLHITLAQGGAIEAFVATVFALIVRSQVTPA